MICIIAKQQSMKTSTNCLILNLAVCDIFITVLLTPNFIKIVFLGGKWFGGVLGSFTCKMLEYGNSVTLYCSLLNLVAIAIDRCLAVTRPLSYKLSSKRLVKISIPVMWLISFSLPKGSLSNTQLYYDGDMRPRCEELRDRGSLDLYITVATLMGSFIAPSALYSVISYRLCRRNIPGEIPSNQKDLVIRTARKVTILMISIVFGRRRVKTGQELTRNRPTLDIINKEEGNIELKAYSGHNL